MTAPRLAMCQFDYELPASAIAQVPIEPRDAARLLVDRGADAAPDHLTVSDLPSLLRDGDVVVLNETRVMAARLPLRKSSGGAVEVLLLEPLPAAETDAVGAGEGAWSALVRPSRRVRDGAELRSDRDPSLRVLMGARLDDQRRAVTVVVGDAPLVDASDAAKLDRAGEPPLPPYIDAAIARRGVADLASASSAVDVSPHEALLARYQTVYARTGASAAAPTAGLHLTESLLADVRQQGIEVVTVDLTVGLGTFAPVIAEHASQHTMHAEHFSVPSATLRACGAAKRVVAVGTTTVRALESAARMRCDAGLGASSGAVSGRTDLFLRRGDEFRVVDALLTNFHLPRSSLLLLIDAFIGPRWRGLYESALAQGYRVLSFGDAMLLERSGRS
ncbi:S-adenosylmethionine:tRNA ribosyltransferase-isomerase [Candidatus Poriferisodalis sp.]|uniref:S-adenosylmethionine:tRNA ribosyltransferase-isomerase n=1 Tax=Candidatus Poriferisodalis sp. TaxID=3101277 RepID=UPI003D0BC942